MQKQFGSALFGSASVNIFVSPALLLFLLPPQRYLHFDVIYYSILLLGKVGSDRFGLIKYWERIS